MCTVASLCLLYFETSSCSIRSVNIMRMRSIIMTITFCYEPGNSEGTG